jgi:ABC-type transport system involved in Fe-S cluster assembly fused permease/ATPase subunit
LPQVSESFDNFQNHTINIRKPFFSRAEINSQQKNNDSKLPKIELSASSLHEALRQVKPFSNEQLNIKVFQRMLDCIRDSSTHSSLSLPVIFVVAALIQGESELLKATKMATRFVDVLFGMIESARVF